MEGSPPGLCAWSLSHVVLWEGLDDDSDMAGAEGRPRSDRPSEGPRKTDRTGATDHAPDINAGRGEPSGQIPVNKDRDATSGMPVRAPPRLVRVVKCLLPATSMAREPLPVSSMEGTAAEGEHSFGVQEAAAKAYDRLVGGLADIRAKLTDIPPEAWKEVAEARDLPPNLLNDVQDSAGSLVRIADEMFTAGRRKHCVQNIDMDYEDLETKCQMVVESYSQLADPETMVIYRWNRVAWPR